MDDDGWADMRLGDLVRIKHGWAFKGEHFSERLTGRPIVVNIGNFEYTGGFKFATSTVREYCADYPRAYDLRPGDMLVVMTCQTQGGEILGIPARIPNDGRVYLHNQRLGKVEVLRPDLAEPAWLYYLFLWSEFNRSLGTSASGTKILHTSPSRIEEFRFRLPPVGTQRQIASLLGALDDKIDLNRRMNATLEELARTTFTAWFVDGVGGVDAAPEGWRTGRLDEMASITMGQSPPGSTYNQAGEGLPFYQGATDFGTRSPRRRVYCSAPARLAESGDVLLSVRAPVGRLNVASERCAIGRGVAALGPKVRPGGFLYYALLASQQGWEKFEASGTVFGAATRADVAGFRMLVPSDAVVRRFGGFVQPLDDRIAANDRESATLAALRNALLPKLLSGELRVKDAEQLAGAAV